MRLFFSGGRIRFLCAREFIVALKRSPPILSPNYKLPRNLVKTSQGFNKKARRPGLQRISKEILICRGAGSRTQILPTPRANIDRYNTPRNKNKNQNPELFTFCHCFYAFGTSQNSFTTGQSNPL